MAAAPVPLALHLVRPSTWEILCGGVDRLDFSPTPPRREEFRHWLFEDDDDPDRPLPTRWVSDTFMLPVRTLRKAGCEAIVAAAWRCLCDTAYPGLPYETWEGSDVGMSEPEGSVPPDEWIGRVDVLVGDGPFEGAVPLPVTLTGPWAGDIMGFDPADPPDGLPRILAWLVPPKLLGPVPGARFRTPEVAERWYWDTPFAGSENRVGLDRLLPVLSAGLRGRLEAAADEGRAVAGPGGLPPVEWSARVDAWIGLADVMDPGCG